MKIFTASSSTPLRESTTSVNDSAKFALASEENRKKAREEAIAAKAEQRDRAIRESEDRFVQETGMRRAKGGIASKTKKKTMKRGGLASKK